MPPVMSPLIKSRVNRIALSFYLLLLFAIVPLAHSQHTALTLSRGLDQLTEEADVIIHGSVTSTRIEPHPQLHNLNTIVVSLEVKDTYKGKPQKKLTFRQFVWDANPQQELAEYGKHQELVLFLGPVSEYGLTSPVGLEQGRFRVYMDKNKKVVASNGRGNLGLFNSVVKRASAHGVTLSPRTQQIAQQARPSPLLLTDLEEAVRTFARAR
jgi:hypothetical protein